MLILIFSTNASIHFLWNVCNGFYLYGIRALLFILQNPNTNLRCSVMSTTVDVDSSDISLSCSDTSSPSVCTGNITEGATYTATVGFSSSLPESQNDPSTSSDQITGMKCGMCHYSIP